MGHTEKPNCWWFTVEGRNGFELQIQVILMRNICQRSYFSRFCCTCYLSCWFTFVHDANSWLDLCHWNVQTSLAYSSSHAKQKERSAVAWIESGGKAYSTFEVGGLCYLCQLGENNKGVCLLLGILTEHRWFCVSWTVNSQCSGLHHSDLNFMGFAKR